MADIQKFESIVRYLKGEIDYDQLGSNLLGEKISIYLIRIITKN